MTLPSDVQRIVSQDEMPASVRSIATDTNPLAAGVLMQPQIDWIKFCHANDLVIGEKGRRTGITYASALDSAIIAASSKAAGGDDVYYIPDTKEKGLEFMGYCAHMSRVMASAMADGWNGIEVFLFDDQDEEGNSKKITAFRIRFASGFHIVALSSNPANIRGLQGIVIIDEAAFHRNVKAVIESATALLIWGGKIRIISTHNGVGNPFNQLVKDARAGLNDFKIFTVFFEDAVAAGLYERVCQMRGWIASVDGKAAWYKKIRGSYGSNKEAMLEELDGVPRDGNGVAIAGVLVEACMKEVRPILRLVLESDYVLKTLSYRDGWIEAWIEDYLKPLLDQLDPRYRHYFGQDFARYGDFSIITPMSVLQDLTRYVPFIIEMKNVPKREQLAILRALILALRVYGFGGGAMDATGNGFGLAEDAADEFGHELIQMVMLSDSWYRTNMPSFQRSFEDGMFDLPRDVDIQNDLRALKSINGIIKLPALRTQDSKDQQFMRHGDSAIALALANFATYQLISYATDGYIAIPKDSPDDWTNDDLSRRM